MATYIVLANFTEHGMRSVKETTRRAEAFRALAKSVGVSVKDIYWTLGRYDIVTIIDAPDHKTVTALGLSLGKAGNTGRKRCLHFHKPTWARSWKRSYNLRRPHGQ